MPSEIVGIAEIMPAIVLRRPLHLGDDLVIGCRDALLDLLPRKDIDRVARDDAAAQNGHLVIEARGAIAAAQDGAAGTGVVEVEHQPIFFQRSTPWNDLIEYHCHLLPITSAARYPPTARR